MSLENDTSKVPMLPGALAHDPNELLSPLEAADVVFEAPLELLEVVRVFFIPPAALPELAATVFDGILSGFPMSLEKDTSKIPMLPGALAHDPNELPRPLGHVSIELADPLRAKSALID